LSRWG